MIKISSLINILKKNNSNFFTGVPDSVLKELSVFLQNKKKKTHIISGPYTSVNLLKNDYIKLKKFGFEELDIYTNE